MTQAIFLSFSADDADVARRICTKGAPILALAALVTAQRHPGNANGRA